MGPGGICALYHSKMSGSAWLSMSCSSSEINRQCSHHAVKDHTENEILSSKFIVSQCSRFSFIYFIQHCLCNDLDGLQTGRDCMFRKFRWLSDILRYKKCDSNIAMRGCSAVNQHQHKRTCISFSPSTMHFHLISPL